MKKAPYYLLSLSLISCQTSTPLQDATSAQSIFDLKSTSGNVSTQNGSNPSTSNLRSSRDLSEMRSSLYKEEKKLTEAEPIRFSLSATDLNKVYILNLKGSAEDLKQIQMSINGEKTSIVEDMESNISDISLELQNLKATENKIELTAPSSANTVKIEVLSFVRPETIPGAVHSQIPKDEKIRKLDYVPGRIGVKFLEGTKVRLAKLNGQDDLKDESGLSLTTLKRFMKQNDVRAVKRALGGDTQRWDLEEAKAEEVLQNEVANLNLFYFLEVDPQTDIWPLIDELRKLPYVEEAYPDFIPQSAAPYTPSDPDFGVSDPIFTSRDQWLRNSHIMQNRSSDPGPDNDGAWSFTRGNQNVKVAVIDYGAQNSSFGSYLPSTHDDLTNLQTISNVNVSGTYTNKLDHGTASAGVIGASGNNAKGLSGVAYDAKTLAIHGFANGFPSSCLGTGISGCDSGADSIILAREQGAKVVIIEAWFPPYTVEQAVPVVRATIAATVAQGVSVIVPAGNDRNTDITKMSSGQNTPDTGSIIVGGLKLDGSYRHSNGSVLFNYGKSLIGGDNDLYTIDGHGVDVSGPAEGIYAPTFVDHSKTNEYKMFGGTSGASPLVAGVVGLMLSVKPDLSPLEIRKTLRTTRVNTNSDNSDMPGMVNAYAAVSKYASGGSSSTTASGLYGKFYANTIFPPEAVLNTTEQNIPFYAAAFSTINHTASPNPFVSSLKYGYTADFQGLLLVPQSGNYTFWVYHDDTASLKIDGQELIPLTDRGDANYGYTQANVYLTAGSHGIQLLRVQERSNADTALWWYGPSVSTQIIPASALSHSTAIHATYGSTYKQNLVGRFFEVGNYTAPNSPLPISPTDANNLMYIDNKFYSQLNFIGGSTGDVFGIGRSDKFQAYFSGVIRLPTGYPSGTYTLKIGHDDGVIFDIEGQRKINYPSPTAYIVHSTTHYLQTGVDYPIVIQYHEATGGADLKFSWILPGSSTEVVVPSSALKH